MEYRSEVGYVFIRSVHCFLRGVLCLGSRRPLRSQEVRDITHHHNSFIFLDELHLQRYLYLWISVTKGFGLLFAVANQLIVDPLFLTVHS
jgi:hypothetical protein